MVLGALVCCARCCGDHAPAASAGRVVAAILANQAWRGRAHPRLPPRATGAGAAPRWGRRWALGSSVAGALWGVAAVAMYPAPPAHEALLIVCLFGVVMGGLNLTAV